MKCDVICTERNSLVLKIVRTQQLVMVWFMSR
jgi:hypothetical protein